MSLFCEDGSVQLCDWYKKIASAFSYSDKRAYDFSKKLYEKYEILDLADSHFLSEIKAQWQQRFWEMYLACTFDALDFKMQSKDKGPDLLIENVASKIWIEAICATQGNSDDRAPDVVLGEVSTVATDKIILRLQHALHEKNTKFQKYRQKNIVSKDDVCIIALNAYEVPNSNIDYPDMPYIAKAVLPIGDMYCTFPSGKIGFHYDAFNTKQNGSTVSKRCFLDDEYKYISAILYSLANAYDNSKPLGYDFILLHNPYAKNPLKKGFLKIGQEFEVVIDGNNAKLEKVIA